MKYQSTRDKQNVVTASQAILKGIAEDGGLYVPQSMPTLPVSLESLTDMPYQEVAFHVLKAFLTDFTDEELWYCINGAYNQDKFDTPNMVSLKSIGHKHYLELFHGQTIAFKDMALSILPYLMTVSAKKNGRDKDILILTATSGDTGKAAMAGFADVPNTKIVVFYPKSGVSHIQEMQMVTQKGNNTHVVGITGNFDDAQSAVKRMFTDEELIKQVHDKGYQFSSANSINIGRLTPQVAYYVYAYAQLVKQGVLKNGEPMNVSVPTGNFGNILAAYYAKQMGVPIKTLICASNKNNVLTDFFTTGEYNKNRPFYVTNSPSMDILISSNLERLLFHETGNNTEKTRQYMALLSETGIYTVDNTVFKDIFAGFADEKSIESHIKEVFDNSAYLLDTHTAVADVVVEQYVTQTGDETPVVIASTASPYKFPRSVLQAFDDVDFNKDDLLLVDDIENISGVPQPQAVLEVKNANILHDEVIDVSEMVASVLAKLEK